MRTPPSWLVTEPCTDVDLSVIKTGKEAQVNLVQRTGTNGVVCHFARKRYLPREVKYKGQLEALGFQRASAFVNDVQYREGRQFCKSRDRRAIERMSTYGKRLLQDRWTGHEHEVMTRLWEAGMTVPYRSDAAMKCSTSNTSATTCEPHRSCTPHGSTPNNSTTRSSNPSRE